jgi:hypothetical protein
MCRPPGLIIYLQSFPALTYWANFNSVHLRKIEKNWLVIPRVYPRASAGRSEGPCVSPLTRKVLNRLN